jgi:hypothetical protein
MTPPKSPKPPKVVWVAVAVQDDVALGVYHLKADAVERGGVPFTEDVTIHRYILDEPKKAGKRG